MEALGFKLLRLMWRNSFLKGMYHWGLRVREGLLGFIAPPQTLNSVVLGLGLRVFRPSELFQGGQEDGSCLVSADDKLLFQFLHQTPATTAFQREPYPLELPPSIDCVPRYDLCRPLIPETVFFSFLLSSPSFFQVCLSVCHLYSESCHVSLLP